MFNDVEQCLIDHGALFTARADGGSASPAQQDFVKHACGKFDHTLSLNYQFGFGSLRSILAPLNRLPLGARRQDFVKEINLAQVHHTTGLALCPVCAAR